MSWCWIMRVNSALRVTEPSLVAWWKQPIVQYLSALHHFPVLCFSHTWAGDLSLAKSSITSPVSCPCVEAQIVGYHIKTQRILLHSPLFTSHHLFHFSQSMLAPFLFFSLALFLFPTLFSLSLSLSSETGWPRRLVLRTSAVGCSDNRENVPFLFFSFYLVWVTHLCTSPLECEIARVCRTELAGGFRCRWQGSHILLETALLWVLVNFAEPPSQILVDQ